MGRNLLNFSRNNANQLNLLLILSLLKRITTIKIILIPSIVAFDTGGCCSIHFFEKVRKRG